MTDQIDPPQPDPRPTAPPSAAEPVHWSVDQQAWFEALAAEAIRRRTWIAEALKSPDPQRHTARLVEELTTNAEWLITGPLTAPALTALTWTAVLAMSGDLTYGAVDELLFGDSTDAEGTNRKRGWLALGPTGALMYADGLDLPNVSFPAALTAEMTVLSYASRVPLAEVAARVRKGTVDLVGLRTLAGLRGYSFLTGMPDIPVPDRA